MGPFFIENMSTFRIRNSRPNPFAVLSVLLGIVIALFIIGSLTGCQSTPVMVRPPQTNQVATLQTNWLSVTNWTTNVVVVGETTQQVATAAVATSPQLVTNLLTVIQPAVYYTNLSLSPAVSGVAAGAATFAPAPWVVPATSAGLGLITGILGMVNERRKRKALGQQAESWQTTAGVLVDNVESLRQAALQIPGYTPALDTQIMRAIEAAQRAAGVKEAVHGLVEERTNDTIPHTFLEPRQVLQVRGAPSETITA